MKWLVNGADVTDAIDTDMCVHEMYAEDRPDAITVRIAESSKWEAWAPKVGDTIRRADGAADTGKMHISSIISEDGFYTIRAMSLRSRHLTQKSRSWEGLRFMKAASDAATDAGLELKSYGCNDVIYKHIESEKESSLAFLQRLCKMEGYAFLTYDGQLVVYDEHVMEGNQAQDTVTLQDDNQSFHISLGDDLYGSCEIRAGKYRGKYKAGNGALYSPKGIKASSNGEAARFARGLLRQKNKLRKSGWIKFHEVMGEYAPGTIIRIEGESHKSANGKVFIHRVIHDYEQERTSIFFRYPLEGY